MNPSVQAQLYQSPVELGQSQQTDKSESEQQSSDNGSEAYYIPDILFQLHDKYIVTQVRDGLIMIDQHAAHERILYETALKALTSGSAVTQKQLFPRLIEFTPMEDQLFEQLLPCLNNMGFGIKPFGPHTYLIESIPAGVKISDEVGLVREMLDYFQEYQDEHRRAEPLEAAAAVFACKAAVKTGQRLSPEEMVKLIEDLFRTSAPFSCPHGRPTYIKIEMNELDRRFKRS